jgi:uncharacterized SAM-binding protein YcdF (DUF218 family)
MLGDTSWQGVAELFLLPPGGLVALFVFGALLGRRWPVIGRSLASLAIAALYLLSTSYVSNTLLTAVEASPASPDYGALRGAEGTAIVVLSANLRQDVAEYGGDTVGDLTLERLRWCARVWRMTQLPVLVSGGVLREPTAIAAMMRAALEQDFTVPVRWVEDRSRTTEENARFSAELLRRDGIGRVVLVTHAFHMPRSILAFRAAGLEVVPAPTLATARQAFTLSALLPQINAFRSSALALHETVGLIWYRFRLPAPPPRARSGLALIPSPANR